MAVGVGVGVGAMEEEQAEPSSSSPTCYYAAATTNSTGTTTIEDLPPDVLTLILRRLDGPSLAAVSCATSTLHALAADPSTWRALCLAMWPSLLHALPSLSSSSSTTTHRALFADAFPSPCSPPIPEPDSPPPPPPPPPLPERLVSAVDLRHGGAAVLSRAVETDTSSDWFLSSPFRVDALVQESFTVTPSSTATISAADLELSWILIDPSTGRALNASTRRPVAVERKWLTGDTVARFAVVLDSGGAGGGRGLALDASVTCDERRGHVREVSLRVEDADGAGVVSGRDGLAALAAAMAAPRRPWRRCRGGGGGKVEEEEEARVRYKEFVRGKKARKEWKDRREGILDLCCSGVGAAAFLGFLVMLAFR